VQPSFAPSSGWWSGAGLGAGTPAQSRPDCAGASKLCVKVRRPSTGGMLKPNLAIPWLPCSLPAWAARHSNPQKTVPLLTRTISRIEAAICQLDGAIRAYFEDDLVSALTLAGAAERVLSDLQPQDGLLGVDAYSWRAAINLYIKTEHQKEAAKWYRRAYDQLRHADRDKSETIEINQTVVDIYILMAVFAFHFVTKQTTTNVRIYELWFCIHYPDLVKKGTEFAARLEKALPLLPEGVTKKEFYRSVGKAFADVERSTLRVPRQAPLQ
jgi:hypothetical protein